jgi:hypothetical protein
VLAHGLPRARAIRTRSKKSKQKAVKMVTGLGGTIYEEKCKELGRPRSSMSDSKEIGSRPQQPSKKQRKQGKSLA